MERGLFIAASGMLAAQIRQDVIANNLANATTSGFKADEAVTSSFGDMLLKQVGSGKEIGPLSLGAGVSRTAINLTQAGIRPTGQPFDLAMNGDGWFAIGTKGATSYTRDGAFGVDAAGVLRTISGDPVLDKTGGTITIPGGASAKVSIDRLGNILADGKSVAQLQVVSLKPDSIRKTGDVYVTGTPDPAAAVGEVRQGYLENSNVNAVKEMVDLITNMRVYEANQKVIRAIDDTLGGAANQVGRVG